MIYVVEKGICASTTCHCAACKPAYSKIWAPGLHQEYFKEMEVDVNGEPIGYIKA